MKGRLIAASGFHPPSAPLCRLLALHLTCLPHPATACSPAPDGLPTTPAVVNRGRFPVPTPIASLSPQELLSPPAPRLPSQLTTVQCYTCISSPRYFLVRLMSAVATRPVTAAAPARMPMPGCQLDTSLGDVPMYPSRVTARSMTCRKLWACMFSGSTARRRSGVSCAHEEGGGRAWRVEGGGKWGVERRRVRGYRVPLNLRA